MADKVCVRVIRNLTDMQTGDEAWVEENDVVTGMVAGGYWAIVDRKAQARKGRAADGGKDQDQPE